VPYCWLESLSLPCPVLLTVKKHVLHSHSRAPTNLVSPAPVIDTCLLLLALTVTLQAFLNGAVAGGGLPPGALLPPPGAAGAALSLPQAVRVRDRATILARQLAAEAGPAAADAQVGCQGGPGLSVWGLLVN
jgi:hypothetical protein